MKLTNFKERRAGFFVKTFRLDRDKLILDLGGGDGSYVAEILQRSGVSIPGKNVWVADLNGEQIQSGKKRYPFNFIKLDVSKRLPFRNRQFDIVFCNSLIEHATGAKATTLYETNATKFREQAMNYQGQLAREVSRVGKAYFVQTPNKYFPIESHTLLPLPVIFLPRTWLIIIVRLVRALRIRDAVPDWNLLTASRLQGLFPKAVIHREKFAGFTKALIAVFNPDVNQ